MKVEIRFKIDTNNGTRFENCTEQEIEEWIQHELFRRPINVTNPLHPFRITDFNDDVEYTISN